MRWIAAALLLAACADNPARSAIDATDAPVAAAGWTCPMHPAVHADGPGACPVCGMPLVEAAREPR